MLPENSFEDMEEGVTSCKAFKIDFENKTVGGFVDGKEALEQAVKMALMTQRYKYPAFSHNYGTDYSEVFANGYKKAMCKLKKAVCDSLCCDERVKAVDNFSFERDGSKMLVSFRVVSVYGETEETIEVSG